MFCVYLFSVYFSPGAISFMRTEFVNTVFIFVTPVWNPGPPTIVDTQ